MPKHFFHSLDGIRGVASILVVLFHAALFFGGVRFQESYLAVDIFFALSGVVISHTYEQRLQSGLSLLHFVWIRIARIYPLYILGTALTLIALLGFYNEYGDRHVLLYWGLATVVLPNPGLGTQAFFPLNIPAWSLFLELAVNIFYAATLRFLTTRTMLMIMALSALGMLGCLIEIKPHTLSLGWRNVGWRGAGMVCGMCRVGYSFFAGVLLYRIYSKRSLTVFTGRFAGIAPWVLLAAITVLLTVSPSATARPYYDFITVVGIFPAIIYLSLWVQPSGFGARVCKLLGTLSYAVYAIHYPLSILIEDLLRRAGVVSIETYAPAIGFAFLACLLPLCWVLNEIYDAPVRRYLGGLWTRNQPVRWAPGSRVGAGYEAN